jgi:uncharacterized protein (DUF58 family)
VTQLSPTVEPSRRERAVPRSLFRYFSLSFITHHSSLIIPRGWRLTSEGLLWLLTAVLLLGIGLFKNINLLALLGNVLLVLLVLNALVAGRRLGRLEARRHVGELIFAGSGTKVELRVRNLSGRARWGVRIEDSGPAHALGWYFDRLEGQASRVCRGEVVLPRRGWYDWGPIVATSGYPFGLIRRRVVLVPGMRVRVLPRPGRLIRDRLRQQLRGVDPRGERVRRRGWRDEAAQADVHGLRPFRPGDSPRWIHWRTSARRGELMIREMEDVPGDDLVLVLDNDPAEPEHFEEAVRLAATIVWEWCRRRGDRLILAAGGAVLDGVSGPEHALRLLECLAEVQAVPGLLPTLSAVTQLARIVPRTAGVVVVSAGPSRLPAVLEGSLGRPATVLDVSGWEEWGFYHP